MNTPILLIRAGFDRQNKINHPMHIPPSLPLLYAQELLRKEGMTQISILDLLIRKKTNDEIVNFVKVNSIEILIIEISSASYNHAIRICSLLKNATSVRIIGVGSDVSERPDIFINSPGIFDFVIRGEYEEEVCRLISKFKKSEDIENFIQNYRKEKSPHVFVIEDLDKLPILHWSKKDAHDYIYRYPLRMGKPIVSGYVSSSRGCKHQCTFCSPSVRKSYGHKLRFRNPLKIVDEIQSLQHTGVNVVSFEDDDLTGSPAHVNAICDEIIKRELTIKWVCHARIDEVNSDMLKKMRQAGCILILFGIESGSPKIIKVIHKVAKDIDWVKEAFETFAVTRKEGIATCAMFLVGNFSETIEDIEQSISLACDLNPDFIKVHNFTLYPGSVDYARYVNKTNAVEVIHHYQEPIINVSLLDSSTLKKIQITFYKRFLFRFTFIISHLQKYLLFYLCNYRWSLKLLKEVFLYLLFSNQTKKNTEQSQKVEK